jgi:hypothetical protein
MDAIIIGMEDTSTIECDCGAKIKVTQEIHPGAGATNFVQCKKCRKQHAVFGIVRRIEQE